MGTRKNLVNRIRELPKHLKFILIILGIVVFFFTFLFFLLYQFKLEIVNEFGDPVQTNVEIYFKETKVKSFYNQSTIEVILPIVDYSVIIDAEGYDPTSFNLNHSNILEKRIQHKLKLKASIIDLSRLYVLDPTNTVRITPLITINGTDILDRDIEMEDAKEFTYGNYDMVLKDPHFMGEAEIRGDKFYQYGWETDTIILDPGENMLWLSDLEVSYVENYLTDYLNLSSMDYINVSPGYPQQFYLTSRDTILSLGDMLFLLCEKRLYEQQKEVNPNYFVPKNKKYTVVNSAFNLNDCYAHTLSGYIPALINRSNIAELVGSYPYYIYADNQLNTKEEVIPISFTFDIESGRYVNSDNKGNYAISPCEDNISSLGLSDLVCDADEVGWFSPVIESTYSEYPYPWVSGIIGFQEILEYSESYGLPLTLYLVDREVNVFEELAPEVIERTQYLVEQDLVEVGSHTSLHSNLAVIPLDNATKSLAQSRLFLMGKFNTSVTGMRGPYFSLVGNDVETHENTIYSAGYSYYAQEPYNEEGNLYITNKPFSYVFLTDGKQQEFVDKISLWKYIITLDHPWNFYYDEEEINNEVYLEENPKRALQARAMLLLAISQGAIPMKLENMEIPE